MSDETSPEGLTNGKEGAAAAAPSVMLDPEAAAAFEKLRKIQQELAQQPMSVRLGAALGTIVAGAEKEICHELETRELLPEDKLCPAELTRDAVLFPMLWGIVQVAQERGITLEEITDEIVRAWTTPDDVDEGGSDDAGTNG